MRVGIRTSVLGGLGAGIRTSVLRRAWGLVSGPPCLGVLGDGIRTSVLSGAGGWYQDLHA
jgi:hypothetical protein